MNSTIVSMPATIVSKPAATLIVAINQHSLFLFLHRWLEWDEEKKDWL